jgi:transcriptional/translational regulatory protein YebC/TACO1
MAYTINLKGAKPTKMTPRQKILLRRVRHYSGAYDIGGTVMQQMDLRVAISDAQAENIGSTQIQQAVNHPMHFDDSGSSKGLTD